VPARLAALRAMALAGYRVGVTIAPVMPVPDWRDTYGRLLDEVVAATTGVADLDLTVEIITHRFTPGSRDVLLDWYPRTKLEMDEGRRTQKRNRFGGVKYVYPRDTMADMRGWFTDALRERLPRAQLLYWT
jgi:spore photoproduct lyase